GAPRADRFAVFPAGTPVPAALLEPLAKEAAGRDLSQCSPRRCALLAQDLDADGRPEWVLLTAQPVYAEAVVLGQTGDAWQRVGRITDYPWPDPAGYAALLDTLREGRVQASAPRFKELVVGDRRYTV